MWGLIENLSKRKLIIDADSLTGLMQNVGLALVTILVPFAIAIIVDILQQKRRQNSEFADLDLHVVLYHLFEFGRLLMCLGLLFIPPLFWDVTFRGVRVIILLTWAFGAYSMLVILKNLYRWIRGNVNAFRFSYLEALHKEEDLEIVWRSVWKAENLNIQNETKYFNIFSSRIDLLLKDRKTLAVIHILLNDFTNFLKNRSLSFLVHPKGPLHIILQWHFKIKLEVKKQLENERDLDIWPDYESIAQILDGTIKSILETSLMGRESFLCFKTFEEHVKGTNDIFYLNHFFDQIYSVIFEKIHETTQRMNIWDVYFPKSWKITKANWQDKENFAAKITMHEFARWAQSRIMSPKSDYDSKLEDVSRELFPEVDPIDWAAIIIFVVSPYDPHNREKSIIEKRWIFGLIGRFHVGFELDDTQSIAIEERRNTIELAILIFREEFSKANVERFLTELTNLKYDTESAEESHRLRLLRIFEHMLKNISDKSSSK